jgi:hypothetical protein
MSLSPCPSTPSSLSFQKARNVPVAVAALQVIDIVARFGNSHAEALSRIGLYFFIFIYFFATYFQTVDRKNKRAALPAIIAEILLDTISSIGTDKSKCYFLPPFCYFLYLKFLSFRLSPI